MSIFNNRTSPVKQEFIWLGEYASGAHLAEFDFITKKENNFLAIKRSDLIRFGMLGHGMHLYYEVFGGVFKLAGQMIELVYKTKKKEYYLTGQQLMYNDIITYKDAEALIDPRGGGMRSSINQYTFGYKATLEIDGVKFNLRALCKIPHGQPVALSIRIVANKKLNGKLMIKKNGKYVTDLDAPLSPGVGGEVNWIVK